MDDKDLVREITFKTSSDIEPLPFIPEDFNKENPFAKEIIETGIEFRNT